MTQDPIRQNSDKLLNTGFKPLFSIGHAADELSNAFATGELVDSEQSHTADGLSRLGQWITITKQHRDFSRLRGRFAEALSKKQTRHRREGDQKTESDREIAADLAKHFDGDDDTVTVAFTTIHDFGAGNTNPAAVLRS